MTKFEQVMCELLLVDLGANKRHTVTATIKFAKLLEESGCALLTIHGRTVESIGELLDVSGKSGNSIAGNNMFQGWLSNEKMEFSDLRTM